MALYTFGLEVIWVSEHFSDMLAVRTNKSVEELESHELIEEASEDEEGTFNT